MELQRIIDDCIKVNKDSKYVKINYDVLDEIISNIDSSKINFWLSSNPFNILELDVRTIIDFLLVYHTIGNYCFWGEPKWEIDTKEGKLDGSYAMIYLIIERIKTNKDFHMSLEEFKEMVKGNIDVPLLDDRYDSLVIMNRFLDDKEDDFYDIIKDYNTDTELFNYLIDNLPYLDDKTSYNGYEVCLFKRAQLLTSDILHVRRLLEGVEVDYTNLVGCADYKIPQVMRCFNILEFSKELEDKIDNKEEIPSDSPYEIEIRANDIVAIDYISKHTNIPRIDINDYLWLLGQDKSKMTKPYHRTRTNKY